MKHHFAYSFIHGNWFTNLYQIINNIEKSDVYKQVYSEKKKELLVYHVYRKWLHFYQ